MKKILVTIVLLFMWNLSFSQHDASDRYDSDKRDRAMEKAMERAEKACVKEKKDKKDSNMAAEHQCKTEREIKTMENRQYEYLNKYYSKDVNVPDKRGSNSNSSKKEKADREYKEKREKYGHPKS